MAETTRFPAASRVEDRAVLQRDMMDERNPLILASSIVEGFRQKGMSENDILFLCDSMNLAFRSHEKTPPRRNGTPFILHPLRVMQRMWDTQAIWNPDNDPEVLRKGLAMGVLHDTAEEVPPTETGREAAQWQQTMLQEISDFDPEVGQGVSLLTKVLFTPEGQVKKASYYADIFKGPLPVQAVKANDKVDNIESSARLDLTDPKEFEHAREYANETLVHFIPKTMSDPDLCAMVTESTHQLTELLDNTAPLVRRPRRRPKLPVAV